MKNQAQKEGKDSEQKNTEHEKEQQKKGKE
jgi:hypothetical protein